MSRLLWLCCTAVLSVGCVQSAKKIEANAIAQSRVNLGLAYLKKQQWQRARQNLEMAVEIAPENIFAHKGFAHFLQQVGETKKASQQYRKALVFAPNNPDLLNNYGAFLCQIGKYDDAEQAFLNAIAQKGYYKLSTSYENAGLCALKFKKIAKAKIWFAKAVNHEPNRYLSSLYLLKIAMKEKAFDHVRTHLASFHEHYGYRASTLLMQIKLEKAKAKRVEHYARLLAEKFPHSREYKQYLNNEF